MKRINCITKNKYQINNSLKSLTSNCSGKDEAEKNWACEHRCVSPEKQPTNIEGSRSQCYTGFELRSSLIVAKTLPCRRTQSHPWGSNRGGVTSSIVVVTSICPWWINVGWFPYGKLTLYLWHYFLHFKMKLTKFMKFFAA